MKVVLKIENDVSVPHWIDDADSYICSVCGTSAPRKSVTCPICHRELHPRFETRTFSNVKKVHVSKQVNDKDFVVTDIAEDTSYESENL